MAVFPKKIENLIDSFSRLPGVGRKTAERFVFYLIKQTPEQSQQFSQALQTLQENLFFCSECYNFSDQPGLCAICQDSQRDHSTLCVVEEIQELQVLENTREYHGLYHVLGGKIDPLEGLTPDKLTVDKLQARVQTGKIKEVILALNPDIQGEGTILYLKQLLRPLKVKITLLARGLPMGGDIEYADEITLNNALKGRQELL